MILPQRVHLFPFRTQKLSSAEAKILAWRRAGKIAHCQHRTAKSNIGLAVSIYIFNLYFFRVEKASLAHVDLTQQAELLPTSHREKYSLHSYSSLAPSVEHMTVNHGVVGSSPTGGARKKPFKFICTSSSVGRATDS